MQRYNPTEIEAKWRAYWDERQTYHPDLNSDKPKYMAMSMFNYPSGAGIHIGHAMNYTISDVKARYKRQAGYESYHPVGWDAFGLPAENFAIKSGISPQASMAKIIPSYHTQYKAMGWSNDWEREIATHEPQYYKWTQWIFSQMYQHGLAYQDSRMQWWCEKDNTVLSNEQVIDGKCWRHDGPDDPLVKQKEVKQWFFKITEYADELLDAIDDLDWTDSVKLAQKNWIGRSIGAEVTFAVDGSDTAVTVFTTRPDTLFGATFLVLAPEHHVVNQLITDEQRAAVEEYVEQSKRRSEVERQAAKEKTGVFTGSYAINPASGQKVPIWIADYVLMGYGTGAIMAVPAHDERDNEFAKKFDLPIREVVEPADGEGVMINSGPYNGMSSSEARERIVEDLSYGGGEAEPTFVQTIEPGKVREDLPYVERQAITAIVKHWKEDKYIGLKWKKVDWDTLITGGIEEGQTAETAAIAEIREETGYLHPVLRQNLGKTHAKFFHVPKNVNRWAHFDCLYFELADGERQEITADEQQNHEVVWLSAEEMETFRLPASHRYTWNKLRGMTEPRARTMVNYKMRDWSVSRQRYWGAPIPIIHCDKCGNVLVPDEQLPVILPELDDFQPSGDGRSALGRATDWLNVDCPQCGGPAERETDTLDTYICSSWYMFRYLDPRNEDKIFDSEIVNKWAPVDFYNGGDHATAHLLYARFVTRFFTKIGLMDNPEPFKQMLFNGKVKASDGSAFSKSKGNGIDPLEIINSGYGADALRTYLMFAAPLEFDARWDPQGVPGSYRFLNRLWTLVQEYGEVSATDMSDDAIRQVRQTTHRMIHKVTLDIEENRYNTAIAASMSAVNDFFKLKVTSLAKHEAWQEAFEALVCCVAPFAPHIAEELWHQLGHDDSVHVDHWPVFDESQLVSDTITMVVQVNGKLRGEIQVDADADEQAVIAAAQTDEKVVAHLADQTIKKTIVVRGKLVNFVV